MNSNKKPFSIAYAMQWNCPYKCSMCHAMKNAEKTNYECWLQNVKPIIDNGSSVRITLTGGEPMLYWTDSDDSLLQFIKYLHDNHLHICLNTTGYNLTSDKLLILDDYIDSILLSVRGLSVKEIKNEFGINDNDNARTLLDLQLGIINNIRLTNIKLEVSTVVTKYNFSDIENLGWKLYSLNPNIIWRVEEYYANGMQLTEGKDGEFELGAAQYDALMINIYQIFSNKFRLLRHSSKESRVNAPDVILFPDGILHQTNKNRYSTVRHISEFDFSGAVNRRDWESYRTALRDRGWKKDKD